MHLLSLYIVNVIDGKYRLILMFAGVGRSAIKNVRYVTRKLRLLGASPVIFVLSNPPLISVIEFSLGKN